jgi:hypothetical protein
MKELKVLLKKPRVFLGRWIWHGALGKSWTPFNKDGTLRDDLQAEGWVYLGVGVMKDEEPL